MLILAIDTATAVASVALADGNNLLGEFVINNKKTHSVNLMPMLDELMKKAGKKIEEVDLFAVCLGPGSFTGIRIGVTAVKSMAYIMNKPVIGINTLDTLAVSAGFFDGIIQPIMDARNRQVFTASFNYDCKVFQRIGDYEGKPIDDVIDAVDKIGSKILFTGDAVHLYKDEITDKLKDKAFFAPLHLIQPRSSAVLNKAIIEFEKGHTMSAQELLPFYLRKSQAEQELERKLKSEEQ